jgi:class 3 adenylate cyclase
MTRAGQELEGWLASIGLERYAQTLRDNDVDLEVLPELTEADLEQLGLSLGHRKKLLRALAGRAVAAETSPPVAPSTQVRPGATSEGERRQLTVMFVDLVGSTELSRALDPEDMADVIRRYQACCADVLKRWDGHVAKYMGDGVMAYFGFPSAHEDDAERAVRAGLDLIQAVSALECASGLRLAVRIAAATGHVMVGELIGHGSAQEETVVGETPNLAARLQTLAPPNNIVIAEGTGRLLGRLFDLEDLGRQKLRGFEGATQAWRVVGLGRAESRFDALRGGQLTPLVGRDHELAILLERWAWTKDSDGQVVLLSGEAGIGKSRLIRGIRERLAGGRGFSRDDLHA